jgi:hypothetical protein
MPLFLARSVINDELHFTLALKNWPRPGENGSRHNTPQVHTIETALFYPDDIKALAVTVIGQSLELAGTRVVAIATAVLNSFHMPFNHRRISSSRLNFWAWLQYRQDFYLLLYGAVNRTSNGTVNRCAAVSVQGASSRSN